MKLIEKIYEYLNEKSDKYEFSPEYKAPSGIEKDKVIPSLHGQGKEALTKIWKKTEELRTIKDEQLEAQAELTELKKKLAGEKSKISDELDGYLKMASNAFDKMGLVINKAYAFKIDEKEVLVALKEEERIISLGKEKAKEKTPSEILKTLLEMGKITEEVVAEAHKEIDKFNEAIESITHIEKITTLYTFPKAQKDVTEGIGDKLALKVKKVWNQIRSTFSNLKKFGRFAENKSKELEAAHDKIRNLMRRDVMENIKFFNVR